MPKVSKYDSKDSFYTLICRVLLGLLVITSLCLIPTEKSYAAPQTPPQRILFIPSYNSEYKGCQWFFHSLMATFEEQKPFKTIFLTENLELSAHPTDRKYWERMAASLKIKYADEKPDLIIIQYRQALGFMKSYGKEIFGDVPVLFAGLGVEGYENEPIPKNYFGITASYSAKKNVELILRNHPQVKNIYVVGGSSPVEKSMVNAVINEGPSYAGKVDFVPLTDLTFPELLTKLGTLRDDSVVMYQALQLDAAGNVFVPAQAAIEIAKASPVPVYGMLDTYKGSGIVGGFLVNHELLGKRTAEIAMNLLQSGTAPDKQITAEPIGSYIFDARQLKRRGIAEDKLPPESQIEFNTLSIWDTYRKEILSVTFLIILQTILIAGLLWNRKIRLRVEESLRESGAALQEKQDLLSQAEELGKVGGWEFDTETKQLTWTKTVYDIHELEFSSQPTVDQGVNYYTPASRPIIEQAVQRAIEEGEPFDLELEIITEKGNLRNVHTIGKADLVRRKVSGFFQDITERKQADSELRRRNVQLTAAEVMAQLGSWEYNVASDTAAWSDNMFLLFDVDQARPEELVFKKFVENLVHPDDRERVVRCLETALAGGPPYDLEYRIRRRNGEERFISARAEIERDAGGKPFRLVGMVLDVTARKQSEAALREKVEDLRVSNVELEQFNRAVVGREVRMIELKAEINGLLKAAGQPDKYKIIEEDT